MSGQLDILRPLLRKTKKDILQYASDNNLQWREDSTNVDEKYLRNALRKNVMPKLEPARKQLMEINSKIEDLYQDIDKKSIPLKVYNFNQAE